MNWIKLGDKSELEKKEGGYKMTFSNVNKENMGKKNHKFSFKSINWFKVIAKVFTSYDR